MPLSKLAQDLIEEINGLNILINGERLKEKVEKKLEDETIEKLTEIRNTMLFKGTVGVIWEED